MSIEVRRCPCVLRWTDARGVQHEEYLPDFAEVAIEREKALAAQGVKSLTVHRESNGELLRSRTLTREMAQASRDFARKFGRRVA